MKECCQCLNNSAMPYVEIKDGLCNACRSFPKIKNVLCKCEALERSFLDEVNKCKNSRKKYDAILGVSGGKDSSYVLLKLVTKYNMKVLAVTFDNGYLSELAKENVVRSTETLGGDHIFIVLDKNLLKMAYDTSIEINGAPCLGCSQIMYTAIMNEARKRGVDYVFHGRSRRQIFGTYGLNKGERPFSEMYQNEEYKEALLSHYAYADSEPLPYIGYFFYHDVTQEEMEKELDMHLGWRQNKNKEEHFDCTYHKEARDMFYHKNKYALDINERNYDIRMGYISRQEALKLSRNDTES